MQHVPGNVTVEQALRKGKWLLTYATTLLMFGTMGAVWCGVFFLPNSDTYEWWMGLIYCIVALFVIILVPTVYYHIMLPRWRILAFSNVRNVHELRRKAILARILHENDNSLSMRLQIMNERQREQLRQLQYKFELPDEFEEDHAILFETVYTSEKNLKSGTLFLLVFLAVAAFLFFLEEYGLGIMMLVVAGVMAFLHIMARNRLKGATLTLSNDGITTKGDGLHTWQAIENERVLVISDSDSTAFFLSYNVAGEKIQISLSEYSAPAKEVDHLLRTYRGRYEANKTK